MPIWLKLLVELIILVLSSIRKQGLEKTHEAMKAECEKCNVPTKDKP